VEGGDARTILKTHDGAIEAVRTLKMVQRARARPESYPALRGLPWFQYSAFVTVARWCPRYGLPH
jgi:hypothetical protein